MLNYTQSFERKPGKLIYIQSEEAKQQSKPTIAKIKNRWAPPSCFFHFGKRGGHLAAIKGHLSNSYFATRDIENFFESISRTKVSRALVKIGFSYNEAFEIAYAACIVNNSGRKVLPYGFAQSMLLASIVLDLSPIGTALKRAVDRGLTVTVYVDDIIISGNDPQIIGQFMQELDAAALLANFNFSKSKSSLVSGFITSFNCEVKNCALQLTAQRMSKFADQLKIGSDVSRAAIFHYVSSVNLQQSEKLKLIS